MHWICVTVFVIFTSMTACENVHLTQVKGEFDVNTANLLNTVLESKSSKI